MLIRFALIAVLLSGCNNTVVIELMTGAQTFELGASELGLPPELRDSGGTIASVDCTMSGICPSTPDFPITCAGVCNPDPLSFAVPVGDVVDFDAILAEASPVARIIDELQIARAEYTISPNGLTFDVPEVEVLWAPESAVSAAEATLLGTLPVIPALTPVSGEMVIDGAGESALSTYVLGSNGRIRFFARTRIDLEPGGRFPEGVATAVVNIRVRAIGRIID